MWQLLTLFIVVFAEPFAVFAKIVPLNLNQFTVSQLSSIGEVRALVENELTSDFMTEDVYLAKWLLEHDFNVNNAVDALRQHLEWRRQEKINTILEEDWQDMQARFPYNRNSTDKKGRPILYFDLGSWDISTYVSEDSKNLDNFGRYFVKMLEESDEDVRRRRAMGQDITQFDLLVNIGGYSNEKHACFQCLYFYRNLAQVLRSHFPLSTEKNVFVNVPYLFKTAYSFLGDENSQSVYLYGQDQQQWEPMILEYIDRDHVPGGLLDGLAEKDNLDGFLQWNKKL